MLQGDFRSILEAADRESFRDSIVRLAESMGFRTVSAIVVVERGPAADFVSVDNIPAAFETQYNDRGAWRRDPVMQHLKHRSVPILWDQSTYVDSSAGDLWEAQAAFGLRSGIAMAMHLPRGHHFVLAVDRDEPLPRDESHLTRIVAHLQLFTVHAQEAAFRVAGKSADAQEPPKLSLRESDVLRWTMAGKTAWEVGMILGISERTAVKYLSNAMLKLECTNKHQAVIKALRFGLIA